MAELVLLAWVWVISGGIALYAYSDELTKDIDAFTAALLVLVWPYWLVQYHRMKREQAQKEKLVPVRIESKDRISKGR